MSERSERTPADVVDRVEEQRFVLEQDNREAELVYRRLGPRLVLIHTEVPEELGGRGVGGLLVQAAVARAQAEGLTLEPQCPFARKWLRDHPDVTRTVVVAWPDG